MARNSLADLRGHLFSAIEALQDEDKPMEPERAKAIAGCAQAIVNSAKVELHAMDLLGRTPDSKFFGETKAALPAPQKGGHA